VRKLTERPDYQAHAGWCMCQAEQTDAPEERGLLLMMAQAWVRLADQSDQIRVLANQASAENAS
jgi:hypothetical protein